MVTGVVSIYIFSSDITEGLRARCPNTVLVLTFWLMLEDLVTPSIVVPGQSPYLSNACGRSVNGQEVCFINAIKKKILDSWHYHSATNTNTRPFLHAYIFCSNLNLILADFIIYILKICHKSAFFFLQFNWILHVFAGLFTPLPPSSSQLHQV